MMGQTESERMQNLVDWINQPWPPDARPVKVIIACECRYMDSVVGTFSGHVLHRAADLLAEHRVARGCCSEFRLEAIWGDTDLGRMDARAALAAIDVADLLGEVI